jgi:tryptophan synthase alpha chain
MNGLEERFRRARRMGRSLFIPYITGGYPDTETCRRILDAMAGAGAEIIELGIPFSDPIADGVTIQEATFKALQAGATPRRVLELAGEISSSHDVSIVILTYLNPVYRMGSRRFMEEASRRGVEGIIIPDLPLEEAGPVKGVAMEHGISLVLLAAPTTSDERLARILDETMGFTYLVSLTGTTGERDALPPTAIQLLRRSKSISPEKPVAVGFGVSRPDQAVELARLGADGVIAGSRIISEIKRSSASPEKAVERLMREFMEALSNLGQ